jgi:signal transduction histidine kinase
VVQEALTNVLKHAGPASAEVTVRFDADAVLLQVRDDGAGGVDAGTGGNGLVGMRERAAVLGGTLTAGPAEGGGWLVEARLPAGVPVAP